MAGFYIIRDDFDTGVWPNDHNLPVYPYETALAIQDRFFKEDGELFYPSHPGDPGYDDFIDAGVVLPPGLFPDGGPTVLTEFFGDHVSAHTMDVIVFRYVMLSHITHSKAFSF
jgi:spore coat protein A